jgi:hypothetical protein
MYLPTYLFIKAYSIHTPYKQIYEFVFKPKLVIIPNQIFVNVFGFDKFVLDIWQLLLISKRIDNYIMII